MRLEYSTPIVIITHIILEKKHELVAYFEPTGDNDRSVAVCLLALTGLIRVLPILKC